MVAILALPLGKFASGATAGMDLKYCDGRHQSSIITNRKSGSSNLRRGNER
jgi:hypothetical protein